MASILSQSLVFASLSAIAALLGGCGGGGGDAPTPAPVPSMECQAKPLSKTAQGVTGKVTVGFSGIKEACCNSIVDGINSIEDCSHESDVNKSADCAKAKMPELVNKSECLSQEKSITAIAIVEKLTALRNLHEPIAFLQDLVTRQDTGIDRENASAAMYAEQTYPLKVGSSCAPGTFTMGNYSIALTLTDLSDACCKTITSSAADLEKCKGDEDCLKQAATKAEAQILLACIQETKVTIAVTATKKDSDTRQTTSADIVV